MRWFKVFMGPEFNVSCARLHCITYNLQSRHTLHASLVLDIGVSESNLERRVVKYVTYLYNPDVC